MIAPVLETERLVMRAHKESDVETEAAFYASDRSKFVGGPKTREDVWRMIAGFIGHWVLRGYGFWALEDRETGEYLGRTGLWCPEGWSEPEIGWTLMAQAEGRGFAYEAAIKARQYAYSILGWKTAISMVSAENRRSTGLAERLGATLESRIDHEKFGEVLVFRHPGPEALA